MNINLLGVLSISTGLLVLACSDDAATGGGGAGNAGGDTSTGAGGTGGDPSSGGGPFEGCAGPEASVQDISTGQVEPGSTVSVNGLVVMSHKFLVSAGVECLYGAFVSAPGLDTTEENSGLLILSVGLEPTGPPCCRTCRAVGQSPTGADTAPFTGTGDEIPDNVVPGDVLDVVGTVIRFQANVAQPGMLQLDSVCKADIVGSATPPAATVITGADIDGLFSTDEEFHDRWGGVKVRIEDVGVEAQDGMVVGNFGIIKLENGVEVGAMIYNRGGKNVCHQAADFPDTGVVFDYVEGFHYIARQQHFQGGSTWGIQANDKCADFSPQSGDCDAATCEPDFLPEE